MCACAKYRYNIQAQNANECHSCTGVGLRYLRKALKHPSVSRRIGLAIVFPYFSLSAIRDQSLQSFPKGFHPYSTSCTSTSSQPCNFFPSTTLFSSLMPRTQPSSTRPSGNLLSRLADWLVNIQGGTAVSMQRTVAIYGVASIVFVDLYCLSEIVVAKNESFGDVRMKVEEDFFEMVGRPSRQSSCSENEWKQWRWCDARLSVSSVV